MPRWRNLPQNGLVFLSSDNTSDVPGPQASEDPVDAYFAGLWRDHSAELLSYANRRIPAADAEDLVARVFEAALRAKRAGGGPSGNARGYLFAALRNEMARDSKAQSRIVPLDEVAERERVEKLSAPAVDPFEETLFREVLESLSRGDNDVLLGVLGHQRRVSEIASELALTTAQVSRRLYKARRRLQCAWIQRHVNVDGARSECVPHLEVAGRVLSGLAPSARALQFWSHVDSCHDCTGRIAVARESSRRLAVVAPAVFAPLAFTPLPPSGQGAGETRDGGAEGIHGKEVEGVHGGVGAGSGVGSSGLRGMSPWAKAALLAGGLGVAGLIGAGIVAGLRPTDEEAHVPPPVSTSRSSVPQTTRESTPEPPSPVAPERGSRKAERSTSKPNNSQQTVLRECSWSSSTKCDFAR